MSEFSSPPRLDIKHAGQSALHLAGRDLLQNYDRLMLETKALGGENELSWSIKFELLPDETGQERVWLHLAVRATLPMTCQRCLGRVDIPVQIDRSFRFVETEAQAELEDDASAEDVLVLSRDFDLQALVEDEILMDIPVVPRHHVCPVAIKLAAADADFEDASEKPNPFAVLAALKATDKS